MRSHPSANQGSSGPGAGLRPATGARTEPVLALLAATGAVVAQVLTDTDGLRVLLDLTALLTATAAVRTLLRQEALRRRRAALGELAVGVTTTGICLVLVLLGRRGPEAFLGGLVLLAAAGLGAVLSVLILAGATVRLLHEPANPAGAAAERPAGRGIVLLTLVAGLVALALPVRDAMFR